VDLFHHPPTCMLIASEDCSLLHEPWTFRFAGLSSRCPVATVCKTGRRKHRMNQQLWDASIAGDLAAVQRVLGEGADVHAAFGITTPLHGACWFGHLEIIRALLYAGADPEAKNEIGYTPLHWACMEGHVEAARILLLEARANTETATEKGLTALRFACNRGNLAVVRLLIGAGANMDAQDNVDGWTPLRSAAQIGHLDIVQLLVGAGANMNAQDSHGWVPLHCTVEKGHLDIV